MTERDMKGGFWQVCNFLFPDLGTVYMLWLFRALIELLTYDPCSFLHDTVI